MFIFHNVCYYFSCQARAVVFSQARGKAALPIGLSHLLRHPELLLTHPLIYLSFTSLPSSGCLLWGLFLGFYNGPASQQSKQACIVDVFFWLFHFSCVDLSWHFYLAMDFDFVLRLMIFLLILFFGSLEFSYPVDELRLFSRILWAAMLVGTRSTSRQQRRLQSTKGCILNVGRTRRLMERIVLGTTTMIETDIDELGG
jgi:hypothetical protein